MEKNTDDINYDEIRAQAKRAELSSQAESLGRRRAYQACPGDISVLLIYLGTA